MPSGNPNYLASLAGGSVSDACHDFRLRHAWFFLIVATIPVILPPQNRALNNLNWIMVPARTEALRNHWDSWGRAGDRWLDKVDWASQNDTVRIPAERMKNRGLEKSSWEETFPLNHPLQPRMNFSTPHLAIKVLYYLAVN